MYFFLFFLRFVGRQFLSPSRPPSYLEPVPILTVTLPVTFPLPCCCSFVLLSDFLGFDVVFERAGTSEWGVREKPTPPLVASSTNSYLGVGTLYISYRAWTLSLKFDFSLVCRNKRTKQYQLSLSVLPHSPRYTTNYKIGKEGKQDSSGGHGDVHDHVVVKRTRKYVYGCVTTITVQDSYEEMILNEGKNVIIDAAIVGTYMWQR